VPKSDSAALAAQHDQEWERAILETFSQNHVEGVATLRVLVMNRVAYIDGAVTSYCQKKAAAELAACAAGSCTVINRARVMPALPSGDGTKAQGPGQPLA